MVPFEDSEYQEIMELARKFQDAVDDGRSVYFDSSDMQDIITFFLEDNDMYYCEKALQYATKSFPEDPYIRLLRSKYFTIQNKFAEAEKELDYVEANFAPIPELYIEKVILAHICNKKINAIELLNKSLSLDNDIPETYLLLTHEYLMDENMDLAVSHAIRAIQLDKYAADDIKSIFIDFSDKKEPKGQFLVGFFKKLTEEMPLFGSLWSGLGLAYINVNDYAHAIEAFQLQLSIDDQDMAAYVNIAESYFGMEEYSKAIEYFTIANENSGIPFYTEMGRCYFKLGDYENAMHYFLRAYEEDRAFNTYMNPDIIRVFKIQGRFDEARAFLRAHLQHFPQDFVAIECLLDLLNPESDAEEVKELCYTAINMMDSDLYQFFSFIVQYCYINNCPDLGVELCENYIDDPSLSDSIHYFLALLFIKKNQIELGCEHLEQAMMIDAQWLSADFLNIAPELQDIPAVSYIINRYSPDSLTVN